VIVSQSAPSVCPWSSTDDADWLTITSSGNAGSTDVSFVAQPNPNPMARLATLTIAGLTYALTQAPAECTYTLPAGSLNVAEDGVTGGAFNFSSAFGGCVPAVVSYAGWLTVTNTSFGGTTGTVTFDVVENPSNTTRVGTIQVGNATFTVRQTGAACGYSLNAYGALFGPSGGDASVLGSPTALGCEPTNGTTQPGFITLGSLIGPTTNIFTQPYTVGSFSSLTRVVRKGEIIFGGQIFVVKQKSY